jgi:hypothetical protein
MRPAATQGWNSSRYQSLCAARARERAWIFSPDHFLDGLLHEFEGLPVSARGQRVAVFAVILVMVRVPVALSHSLDQRRRHGISLDRERVIRVALVDFVDEMQIRTLVFRQPRRFRKILDDAAAPGFPQHSDAADNRSNGRTRRREDLTSLEWIAFAHVVAGAGHGGDDFIRQRRAPGFSERPGEIARLGRVPAVQQQPEQVGRVSQARENHLRFDRVASEAGFAHPHQRSHRGEKAQSVARHQIRFCGHLRYLQVV